MATVTPGQAGTWAPGQAASGAAAAEGLGPGLRGSVRVTRIPVPEGLRVTALARYPDQGFYGPVEYWCATRDRAKDKI